MTVKIETSADGHGTVFRLIGPVTGERQNWTICGAHSALSLNTLRRQLYR
jgi:hypothetical protein